MSAGTLLLVLLAFAGGGWAQIGGAPLGPDGAKAYQMARSAEDTVKAAQEEGTAAYQAIQGLAAPAAESEPLKTLQAEATAAHEALVGYRKRALESAGEALSLLAEVTRAGVGAPPPPPGTPAPPPGPDPIRREVYEQKALLAAHEASVMAARARTQAERLRAILAEGKALLAAGRPPRAAAPAASREVPPKGETPGPLADVVEVPNLVGARLDSALRDLQVAGLRLGATVGPREGYVVKQTPAAGTRVPRQAAVSVTLSATAAGSTPGVPR